MNPSGVLREKVAEAMARLRVPGVAVGILHDGEEHVAGFGVTNVDHPLAVDGDTLFQVGSITKTFTGTVVMRLVEMGRLDLDAPVRTYLPDLQVGSDEVAARVALRHLLTHTAGWVGDVFDDDLRFGDDALARFVTAMAEVPQQTPLGALWSYSNSGFCLAGRVIEVVTGKPYEAVVEEFVLTPLGMAGSHFGAWNVITHRVAAGHHVRNGTPVVARPWALSRSAHPSGGLVSTVRDQLRYARFHLGDGTAPDGTRLLSAKTMALMQSPLVEASGGQQWGLSWGVRNVGGARVVFHGGATTGQAAAFLMVPERRFAIAVLTNADQGGTLHAGITAWALGRYLGLEEPEPAMLTLPAQELAPYLGRYAGGGSTSDIDVSAGDGHLILRHHLKGGFPAKDVPPPPAPPPMRAGFTAADRWVVLDGPAKGAKGEFLRGPDGRIAWLRWSRIRARQA
jgi:CubicO group peptidase (beta-lactamase class C family)